MFTTNSYAALSLLDTPYTQSQLHPGHRMRGQQPKFHPYSRTMADTLQKQDQHQANVYANQFLGHQTHRPSHARQSQGQCHYQYEVAKNVTSNDISYSHSVYTYPTLGFLLPSNSLATNQTTQSINVLSKEYGHESVAGKQKRTDQLHPFYRRQLLTVAPSRDGLTRTRDKYRVVYSERQKTRLEEEYQKNSFLPESRRTDLAQATDLSERQIKFWFQNRRAKDKRDKKARKNPEVTRQSPIEKATKKNTDTPDSTCNVIKQSELPSCKFTRQTSCITNASIPSFERSHVQNQETPKAGKLSLASYNECQSFYKQCQYSNQPMESKSVSPTTGSCRFENITSSPTGTLTFPSGFQFQYPVSPSEWVSSPTNQNCYFNDNMEMSPLLNGLQRGFEYRL